jgi:hypothetical protein
MGATPPKACPHPTQFEFALRGPEFFVHVKGSLFFHVQSSILSRPHKVSLIREAMPRAAKNKSLSRRRKAQNLSSSSRKKQPEKKEPESESQAKAKDIYASATTREEVLRIYGR